MRFHCETNPNFSLQAPAYGIDLRFTDGYYETTDKEEIRQLGKQDAVVEAEPAAVVDETHHWAPPEFGEDSPGP